MLKVDVVGYLLLCLAKSVLMISLTSYNVKCLYSIHSHGADVQLDKKEMYFRGDGNLRYVNTSFIVSIHYLLTFLLMNRNLTFRVLIQPYEY